MPTYQLSGCLKSFQENDDNIALNMVCWCNTVISDFLIFPTLKFHHIKQNKIFFLF